MGENPYYFTKWGTTNFPLLWEDLHRFSKDLRKEFPTVVLFPPDFQSAPSREASRPFPTEPAQVFEDIYSCIHTFPSYYNWGACIRLATEAEIASGDPERMIGGRRDPTSYLDEAEFLKAAPQVYLWLHNPEDCFLRLSYYPRDETRHLMKPIHDYPPVRMVDYRGPGYRGAVDINGFYGINDSRGKSFAMKVRSLLSRNVTRETALYDPRTGEIVDNAYRYKLAVSRFGLEYCALHDYVYLGKGPVLNDIQTWIGPRQKLRDRTRHWLQCLRTKVLCRRL